MFTITFYDANGETLGFIGGLETTLWGTVKYAESESPKVENYSFFYIRDTNNQIVYQSD